jgi:anti-anti-sigma regulatory factor
MVLKLKAELSIAGAAELKAALLAALAAEGPVSLDASAVTAVDLAGLQLLCAAHKSAALAGKALSFAPRGRSEVLDRAAATGGFFSTAGAAGSLWQVRPHG